MDKHICPKCSQECIYKNGIMCTIDGCTKDGTATTGAFGDINNVLNNMFGGGFGNNFGGGAVPSSNPFADILNKYKK